MIKQTIKLVFALCLIGLLGFVGMFAYFARELPDPTKISERQIIQSTKIYDRTGEVILYDIHGEERRTVILLDQIPEYVKESTIAIEDDNFYNHIGLDWRGILRAAWSNIRGKKISQGGSTITQQFIKNAYLGGPQSERTFARKIKEAILALLLERKYTKDEILESYLNQVPYGSNAYGIEAASQTFFDRHANELTLAESALLAALPQAPSYYSPYGSHPDELKARQEYILDRMVQLGYIAEEEIEQAKQEELKYAPCSDLKAHHFVSMVREYVEEEYGRVYSDINTAGLKVYTTLDWDMQRIAEEAVNNGAERNEKYGASNAALAAIDPKTGEVIALVGSKDYEEDQFNVATSPYRQPGSSFKPFAYAVALEKGLTPDTILFDVLTNFGEHGGEEYIPHNYTRKCKGPLTIRSALAQSINIVAVKTLYIAGISDTINLAQDMGITTLKDRSRYSLALVLGGGEIKLIDEVSAYGVFATEGVKHPTHIVLRIEDAEGNILEEHEDDPVRVLDRQIARQLSDILSDEAARAPMMGAYSKLYLSGIPAAAKTGTTQDYSDGWTVGYTPSLTAGAWAGNNDYTEKMNYGAAGLTVAAPIWNEFMKKAYQLSKEARESDEEIAENRFLLPEEKEYFASPEPPSETDKPMLNGEIGYQREVEIDSVSGKLATEFTPPELIETRIYPEAHTLLYYVDKGDITGPFPKDPYAEPQFERWEEAVLEWAAAQSCDGSGVCYNQQPPTEYDDIHIPENMPEAEITFPGQYDLITNPTLTIKAEAQALLGIKQIDFFFNGQLVGTDNKAPYSIKVNLSPYLEPTSLQKIKIRAYDTVLNRKEDEITIRTNF